MSFWTNRNWALLIFSYQSYSSGAFYYSHLKNCSYNLPPCLTRLKALSDLLLISWLLPAAHYPWHLIPLSVRLWPKENLLFALLVLFAAVVLVAVAIATEEITVMTIVKVIAVVVVVVELLVLTDFY